jgi:hypothetical protein
MELAIRRGDTLEFAIQVFQTDGITPFNLTGAEVFSTIKKALSDIDAAAVSRIDSVGGSVPVGGVITIDDATNGKATIRHAASATSALTAAQVELFYDVQVVDSIGRVFTVDSGIITVSADVTQRIA